MSAPTSPDEVTLLLDHVRDGDRGAFDRLFPLVYGELRKIAARRLGAGGGGGRGDHTLAPTALVHEAYLKMLGQQGVPWQSRAHFLAIAARAMRQILIDHARRKQAAKRGGDLRPTTLTGSALGLEMPLEELLALDQALERLNALDARLRKMVELRFFGGLQEKEVAEVLGVTPRTVQRDWVRARAWLYKELYGGAEGGAEGGADGEACGGTRGGAPAGV